MMKCLCSFVKTYDEAQDSTLGVKKRKIEDVTEVAESKPKKAKLTVSSPTAATSGTAAMLNIHGVVCFSKAKLWFPWHQIRWVSE